MHYFKLGSIISVLCLIFPGIVFSQSNSTARATQPYVEFKVGQLKPNDTEDGILFGLSSGRRIDDRLFWAFEADYFYTSFTEATNVAGSGTDQVFVDFTTSILTFLFQVYYEARMGPGAFFIRGSGGMGLDMIWDKQRNLQTNLSRSEFYTGFAWQLTGGIGWQISRRGLLFFDTVYHGSSFTSSDTQIVNGFPVTTSIDVSGFGFRAGINIIGFWFWKW